MYGNGEIGLETDAADLAANEARLRALISNVPGAIYRCALDSDWTMELIGDEIERISGYPSADFIDSACRTFASVIHPDDRDGVERSVQEAVEVDCPFALEYRISRADGGVRWVLERGQLVSDGAGRSWLDGVIFDISERREAEETLRRGEVERARTAEIRASSKRIIQAADDARRAIERDLHDGAQQQLVALLLDLNRVRDELGDESTKATQLLDGITSRMSDALAELRELARGIHPAVLLDRGLEAALTGLTGRCPVPVQLRCTLNERLPAPVESTAYFVAAEALTNVAKYAEATEAAVDASMKGSSFFVIEISDDGRGGADPSAGSGLRGLADRVEALDGHLDVESPPMSGTVVRATIPS